MLRPQKVCHLTSVHEALDDRIFYRECLTLAKAGYRVIIIAPGESDAVESGIQIRSVPVPSTRRARMLRTTWQIYRAAVGERADIYHLHDPELLVFAPLLRLRGKQVIYDAHEDTPNDVATKEWIPRWLHAPVAACATLVLRGAAVICSRIVAATPHIAKRFPEHKTAVVANYPDLEQLGAATYRPFEQRARRAAYVGSISQIRGIREMVRAFERSKIPADARLVIAGRFGAFDDGALEREVRTLSGWSRVDFRGWQSRDAVAELLCDAQVGLLVLHPKQSFIDSLPSKLFEYMAAGLPVVASDFPLWRAILENAGCGVLVDPLDADAIADAIGFLLSHQKEAEAMGERGRRVAARTYNWANEAQSLLGLYEGVCGGSKMWAVQRA